ncbi:MAG: hypothetical protein ACTFAL_13460 [Candidatus Electronema sp. V4]|uniref:hypothetical protein n=1 Tax=Candidatus Electronema sp. V4 TaxID=3454756 RepID=UPI00405587DC
MKTFHLQMSLGASLEKVKFFLAPTCHLPPGCDCADFCSKIIEKNSPARCFFLGGLRFSLAKAE